MLCRASGPAWAAIYTKPKGEAWAILGIAAFNIPAWTPQERIITRRRGKAIAVTRPYFPRYIFADIHNATDTWRMLERIDGVENVLTNDQQPMLIPTTIIKTLQHAERIGAFDLTTREPIGLKRGDHVAITGGPFDGMQATIQSFMIRLRSTSSRKRARVLVDFIGRWLTVDLPIEQLEKI